MSAAPAATGGSPGQASSARLGVLPVLLDRDGVLAPTLRTSWPGLRRQDGVGDEARRQLAAPLGDEGIEVHGDLLFRLNCRRGSASVPGQAARARRPVTSRQRGRSVRRTRRVDRPSTRDTLAHETDDRTCGFAPVRRGTAASRAKRPVRFSGAVWRSLTRAAASRSSNRRTSWLCHWWKFRQPAFRWHVRFRARRAQALAIVTRRDEAACGLGRRRR